MTEEQIKQEIEQAAQLEEIYEPKYGGKDHSGYGTLMKYEVNGERSECFEKGAWYIFNKYVTPLQARIKELEGWKESAIAVMPDFQAIGKEIGVPLGRGVSPEILPWIIEQKRKLKQLEEENERLKAQIYTNNL